MADRESAAPAAERERTAPPDETTPRRQPPTIEDIARRAYELYKERGGTDGQEVDDWLRAEAELRDAPGRRDDEL